MAAQFEGRNEKVICLFDVDGTLTPARLKVKPEMEELIAALRKKVVVGTVGGSDFPKQKEQLGDDVQSKFDYCFAENGLTAFKGQESLGSTSFVDYLGEEKMKEVSALFQGLVVPTPARLSLPRSNPSYHVLAHQLYAGLPRKAR